MFDVAIYDINGNPIEKLYQYDTCVKIQIKDLEFEETPIVHFCNRNTEKAYAILREYTEYENGVVTVEIPSVLLKDDLMIYVYIYVYDNATRCGRTIHVGNIPVESKPKPEDYIGDPEWYGLNAVNMHWRITRLEEFRDATYVKDMEKVDNRITTEINDRIKSDNSLLKSLQSETSSRENADNALDVKFTGLLETETNNRSTADSALLDALNAEINNRVSDTNKVEQIINTETQDRKTAILELDEKLSTTISNEISNREDLDNRLSNNITQEISDRKSADEKIKEELSNIATGLKTSDDSLQSNLNTEIEDRVTENTKLQNQISSNKQSIDILNGTGEGSVSKQITDSFNDFTTKISNDGIINTYKEAVDYVAEHGKEATAMMGNITKNMNAINELKRLTGVLPDSSAANSVVEYVNEEILAVNDKIVATEKRVETNAKKYADQTFVPMNDLTVVFDTIYPVGSIYATKDPECIPDDLFGGTWQLDENMPIDAYYLWERLTLAE